MDLATFKKHKIDFFAYLEIERNLSKHTQRSYQSDLNILEAFWEKVVQTEPVTLHFSRVIERLFVALFHKKMHQNSIARKISCLRSFSAFLKTIGIDLPITLTRPALQRKLPVYLSVDEVFYLLDTVQDHELP